MEEKKLPTVQEPSNEECILVLENLKERTTRYGSLFRHCPKDYLDRLAQTDVAVLDKVISILKNNRQTLESIIHVIGDIKECLLSDGPVDAFLKRWAEHNPEVPDCEKKLRGIYAAELQKAESILKSLL